MPGHAHHLGLVQLAMDVGDVEQLLTGRAPHPDLAVACTNCYQGWIYRVGGKAVDEACKAGQGVQLPAGVQVDGNQGSVLSNSVSNPIPSGNAEEILKVVPMHHRELAAPLSARLL